MTVGRARHYPDAAGRKHRRGVITCRAHHDRGPATHTASAARSASVYAPAAPMPDEPDDISITVRYDNGDDECVNVVSRRAITVALVVLLAGCTSHPGRPTAHATTSRPPASTPVSASRAPGNGPGCGDTPISPGQPPGSDQFPDWTADAGLPTGIPYAVSVEANVVAVLFGYPLRAGHNDDGRNNKILWDMRDARDGQPLLLTARPLAGGSAVNFSFPANASPGEIYPSIVDVPAPGCWHMTLQWNGHTATIDLPYSA